MTQSSAFSIRAVTLATSDMGRALRFYEALGFALRYGDDTASFSSLDAGSVHLNLIVEGAPRGGPRWGRIVFHVDDVDALHQRALSHGLRPEFAPRDATWGDRYFHIVDPDGHELSFGTPLR